MHQKTNFNPTQRNEKGGPSQLECPQPHVKLQSVPYTPFFHGEHAASPKKYMPSLGQAFFQYHPWHTRLPPPSIARKVGPKSARRVDYGGAITEVRMTWFFSGFFVEFGVWSPMKREEDDWGGGGIGFIPNKELCVFVASIFFWMPSHFSGVTHCGRIQFFFIFVDMPPTIWHTRIHRCPWSSMKAAILKCTWSLECMHSNKVAHKRAYCWFLPLPPPSPLPLVVPPRSFHPPSWSTFNSPF